MKLDKPQLDRWNLARIATSEYLEWRCSGCHERLGILFKRRLRITQEQHRFIVGLPVECECSCGKLNWLEETAFQNN